MTAEIHRLTNAGPILEPDKEIVELLERLLGEAKAGDIKGFGFFLVNGVDTVSTGWKSGCAPINGMVAGAARLNFRVCRAAHSD